MSNIVMQPDERGQTWPVRVFVIVGLLGALALRLLELGRQDIWWDEARNIDVALRPFLSIATSPELDIHPPVYFWSLHLWSRLLDLTRILSPEMIAYGTRLFSVFAGVIGVALLFALGRRAVGHPAAGAVAALVGAASPFWLAESQETRMYTLAFLLITAAAICLIAVAVSDNGQLSVPHLIGLVVFSTLALLTHYNAAFILVSWYVWWGATA